MWVYKTTPRPMDSCESSQLEPTDHVPKEVPLLKKATQEEGGEGGGEGSLPLRGLYGFNQKQLWPV